MNPRVVEVKEERRGVRCDFCHKSTIDTLMLGQMYKLGDLTIHYFCLLFSAGLSQNGEDNEGILGFLPKDIKKEVKRGNKLKCKYCKGAQATVGCSVQSCKVSFHYPCGLEEGALYQFIHNYESYCIKHRPLPVIPLPVETWRCPICFSDFVDEKYPIKPPCCNNNAVFHRKCIMEAASKSGLHFFKCPLCNDKETFGEAMRLQGIYVPDRDAEWELEPNAFEELNQQYNRCDRQPCLCPSGREFNGGDGENKDWKLIRCGGCGAAGVHMKCGDLTVFTYRCETCTIVLHGTDLDSSIDEESSQRTMQNLTPARRTRHIIDSDDEDVDEPVHNILDSLRLQKLRTEGDDGCDSDSHSSAGTASTSSSAEAESESSKKQIKGIPKKQNNIVSAYGKTYELVGGEDCSSELEDEEDEDYLEETEDDFISASKNISGGNIELEEKGERCQKNDAPQVRTGLVEVAQNRSDLLEMVTKVCEFIERPLTDRALRHLYPLPPISSDSKTTVPSPSEETLKKMDDVFREKLLAAFNQVVSEKQELIKTKDLPKNHQQEQGDGAHCSRSLPKIPTESSTTKTNPGRAGRPCTPKVNIIKQDQVAVAVPTVVTSTSSKSIGTKVKDKPKESTSSKQQSFQGLRSSTTKANPSNKSTKPQTPGSSGSIPKQNPVPYRIPKLTTPPVNSVLDNKSTPIVILQASTQIKANPTKAIVKHSSSTSTPSSSKTTPSTSSPSKSKSANTKSATQSKLDTWLSPTLACDAPPGSVLNPFSANVRNISISPEFCRDAIIQSPAVCSPTPIATSVQLKREENSSKKSPPIVNTIVSDDDDDDCMVVEVMPASTESRLARKNAVITIKDEDDDDDVKIDAVKLVTDTKTSPMKMGARVQRHNTATALKHLNSSTKPEPKHHRKFFSGGSTVGLSAALIANSSGLMNSIKKCENKTNSGSVPADVIILDSDDEEPTKTTNAQPTTSNNTVTTKSEDEKPSGENDTVLIPNRDRDRDLQSSMPKRVRIRSDCEETEGSDDSKRPRVSN